MLRVAFDSSAVLPDFRAHAARGTGRYVRELKNYFDSEKHALAEAGVEILDFQSARLTHGLLNSMTKVLPVGRMTIRQQVLFPLALQWGKTFGSNSVPAVDFFHFPTHLDAPASGYAPSVVTVLDLIPHLFPSLYGADDMRWRFRLARFLELRAIRRAKSIVTISECSARDIVRELGIPREKITVTYLGIDQQFLNIPESSPDAQHALRMRLGLPLTAPVILYVGGIDPRKNIQRLFNSFAKLLRAQDWKDQPVLAFVGKIASDKEYPKLQAWKKASGLDQGEVIELGFVPDEDLFPLYRLASLLFFPSLYEGFGFPALEAMATGLPVVCSNTSSLPEVVGDAAELCNPEDEESMVAGMLRVLTDANRAEQLKHAGPHQAKKFRWDSCGIKTVQAYLREARVAV